MMFCKNCGAKLPENAKFCPQCATPVDNKENSQTATNPTPASASSSSPRSEEPRRAAASTSPAVLTKSFGSMIEADNWLAEQDRIIITSFSVSADTIPGFEANHPYAVSVIIRYWETEDPTGWIYGVAEEELYRTRNVEADFNGDFSSLWSQTYPDLEIMKYHTHSSTRTTYSGLEGREMMVSDVSSYIKYFVLYREISACRSRSLENFGTAFSGINENTVAKAVGKIWYSSLSFPLRIIGILFGWITVVDALLKKDESQIQYLYWKYHKLYWIECLTFKKAQEPKGAPAQ